MKISILGLCIFALMTGAIAGTNPFTEIKNLGFSPTLTKPADFSTQMAFQEDGSLSDYKGKWIVLGVSIDKPGSEKSVQEFLKKKKISFPNFLDDENEIASEYIANAVPSIYLISPDWKLVGIARGARDWSGNRIAASLSRLLKIKEVPENAELEKNSISLPGNLTPPILKSVLSKTVADIGQQLKLDIFIQWQGRLEQYLFKVPKPHLPTNIKVGQVSSESFQKEGVALLKYSYPLTFQESGSYTVGPIEMEYKSRLGGGFQATREPGIKVEISQASGKLFVFYFIGFALLLII